jgi:hypothetical protein
MGYPGALGGRDTRYPADKIMAYGLRDKFDQSSGLSQTNPNDVQVTTVEYQITVDTRDCVGMNSLADAQTVALFNGNRDAASGSIINTTGPGVTIVLTLNSVLSLRNGDTIFVDNVMGNTAANGEWNISAVTITSSPVGTVTLNGSIGNGVYAGGGTWERPRDPSYPILNPLDSIIKDNEIIVNLPRQLRELRSMALYHMIIPRDIIPLSVYIPDFVPIATTYGTTNTVYPGLTESNYTTFVPQEKTYLEERIIGFYSSPLDIWRSYISGSMSMPDLVTPSPLELWNPPAGTWPTGQPVPYPFQTVPSYKSNDFTITGFTGLFHLILSGYGIYDLLDWTVNTGNPVTDSLNTSIMRKLLLMIIVPKQSYRDVNYIDLIIASNVVTPGNLTYPFGYGDFQRFVPGPGVGMTYQPGTNTLFPGDPTQVSADSPINFPNFRGNVFGPYNYPGARFQRMSLTGTIQDLYMNGDLNNLYGDPIIIPGVPVESLTEHPSFGLNLLSLIEVNLSNVGAATNPNITNAMRITPNGFGTTVVRANGLGNPMYTSVYGAVLGLGSGGQGPSYLGPPNAWVNHGIYSGTGTFTDPKPQGPLASNTSPQSADSQYPGNVAPEITNNTAFYDMGPNSKVFGSTLQNYIDYASNEIPDTDLIMKIQEAERNIRSLSTNSNNSYCMLDFPIRLSLGSFSGTLAYVENNAGMISSASFYWEQRYMVPLARMDKLHLSFFTYNGTEIPLEKMLKQRRSLDQQRLVVKILNELSLDKNPFNISYLFDPLNPKLEGRLTRYIQMIFKANCYESVSPGIMPSSYQGIPGPSPNSDPGMTPYI